MSALAQPMALWDSHLHVFGSPTEFPLPTKRAYTPPERSIAMWRAAAAPHGVTRAVLVQPSVYSLDHRCLLQALDAGGGRHRGVAAVAADASDMLLDKLHAAGVRGLRFNGMLPGGQSLDSFDALAKRVAARGWHAQILVDAAGLPAIAPIAARTPIPIVLDHFGGLTANTVPGGTAWRTLAALLVNPQCWVKLSGFYRLVAAGRPYEDLAPLAQALADIAPDRLLWGSDWPHTWFFEPGRGAPPDYGDCLAIIDRLFPGSSMRERLLIENPTRLYA